MPTPVGGVSNPDALRCLGNSKIYHSIKRTVWYDAASKIFTKMSLHGYYTIFPGD